DKRNNLIQSMERFYKNYSKKVDEKVFEAVMHLYKQQAPQEFLPEEIKNAAITNLTATIYKESSLTNYEDFKQLLKGSSKEVFKKLKKDKGYFLAKAMAENYFKHIMPKYEALTLEINALQRTYMKAQLELYPDARIFPDANSTLRVTYGKVKGYSPKDAISYAPVTYLEG